MPQPYRPGCRSWVQCPACWAKPKTSAKTRASSRKPFAYQVRATTTHSLGAIKALRAGLCNPDLSPPPTTIAALRDLIGETITTLEAIDPGEIDSYVGKDMRFEAGAFALDFLAENFMLSFANPNFFFHATTAYDILRVKGLQIGKRDFVGRPRLKA